MSDQGTRINVNPTSSQTIRMTTRRRRFSINLELWEIIAGLATRPIENRLKLVVLQRGDAVRNVAVIDIHRINLAETIECFVGLSGHLQGYAQVVSQCENCFLVQGRHIQSALIPESRNFRFALVSKRKRQQNSAIHRVTEGLSFLNRFCHLLKFTDGFIEKTHLTVSNSEIVVGLKIFIFFPKF